MSAGLYLNASIDGYGTWQLLKRLGKLLNGILSKTRTFLTVRCNLFPELYFRGSCASYKPVVLQQTCRQFTSKQNITIQSQFVVPKY